MKKAHHQALQAYQKYYSDRDYEQVDLFRRLRDAYGITCAVYPGSYIQVSPSFIFARVAYIDSDKQAVKFFQGDSLREMVRERKEYPGEPEMAFHGRDYRQVIEDYRGQFDLLISQYAGFISGVCKPYLRKRGYLLANNSHGDAGLASLDPDYQLIAAVHRREGQYRLSTASLDEYFIPKKDIQVNRELLLARGKGVGYTKTAPLYLFQKIG